MRRAAWFCFGLVLALTLSATTRAASPALARYFPRRDLAAYAEFDGLDGHADIWKKTAAYRLLNETTAGAMLDDVATQLLGRALASTPGQPATAAEMRAVVGHAVRSGFAFGVVHEAGSPRPPRVGIVLRGAGRAEVRGPIEKALGAARGPDAKPTTIDKPGGRTLSFQGGSPEPEAGGLAWWREGDDLVMVVGPIEGADLMIEALDGRTPDANGHPARVELARTENGFTPIGFAFVGQDVLKDVFPGIAAYGFDQVTQADYRWGVHGDALMTVTRLAAPAPRSGLLALLDQPTFGRAGLPPMPAGLGSFTAVSVDAAGLYDRVAAGFANTDPATAAGFEAFEKSFRQRTGLRVRDDVLTQLGPKFTYYALPARVEAPANVLAGLAQGLFATPAAAVVIEVKDVDRVGKLLDDAMARAQQSFMAEAESGRAAVRIKKLEGAARGYVVSVSPTSVPLPAGTRPTVILGKSALVVASNPGAARQAVALEKQGGALPASDPLAWPVGRLPDGMILAHVGDARRSLLPELIANLPGLVRWYGTTPMMMGFRRQFGPNGRPMPFGAQPGIVEIDPDLVPAPDELRPFLFPSESTLTADDRGFRLTTRDAFPALNPVAVAPVAAVLLLPALQARQAAALRVRSVNNLKQMGLAFHNYHDVNGHFPAAAIVGKDGKPLLSWRVAILPYIEQGPLYNEFHLDEPWDSPHNKPLAARMPATYAIPNAKAAPDLTFYRGFSGDSALFDPKVKQGVGMQTITDGTSNTIGIVEAKTAVPWTKPGEEIPFDPAAPPAKIQELLRSLGGHSPGGFNALFLDGSVRFIKQSINIVVLKALLTRNGGEVIAADSY